MTYAQFRTGLCYRDVFAMLWVDNPDRTTWKHKSRGVVLWHWSQINRAMWDEFCARNPEAVTDDVAELDARIANDNAPAAPPPAPLKVAVRKEITHRGRKFFVTYWTKPQKEAA